MAPARTRLRTRTIASLLQLRVAHRVAHGINSLAQFSGHPGKATDADEVIPKTGRCMHPHLVVAFPARRPRSYRARIGATGSYTNPEGFNYPGHAAQRYS
jgi:hypothetical protein